MPHESKNAQYEKAFNRLKNLPQNKNLTDEQIKEKAIQLINAKEVISDINIESMFIEVEEQDLSVDLLKKYLQDYTIETVSDKNTLRQVIYLEVLNIRLQKALNELQKDIKVIPDKLVKTMHDNLNQIIALKDKLGITRTKESETTRDSFGYLQMMKRKYKVWLANNQATRHRMCPHCKKFILLVIKPESWLALKHPFFKDRILGNETLIKVYKSQKPLTKEDVRDIFGVSNDYVDFLITKGWGLTLESPKTQKVKEIVNEEST